MLARDQTIDTTPSPDYVARARALVPAIEAAASRIEAERRIVPDVVAALHEAGIFHMLLPPSLGGGGADIVAFNEVIQTIAAADASTGWCVGQQVASTQAAGYVDPKIAREIFGPPHGAVAWGPPAGAKAVVTDGGYRVTGRWRFASGSGHCAWIGGHSAVIERDGKPRLDDKGRPVMRTMLFRNEQAKWTDIWHTVGLRGTGSNQYEVSDLFVPDAYSTWRDEQADRTNDGPLYDIPLLTLYGIGFSGVGLGLAQGSLDAFMALANSKTGRAGRGVMRDNPIIQSDVAKVAGGLHCGARVPARHAGGNLGGGEQGRRHARPARATAARHHRRARPIGAHRRLSPTPPPRPARSSPAVHSSAASATCTPSPRRARRTCRISNPPARRCSASSRCKGFRSGRHEASAPAISASCDGRLRRAGRVADRVG